MPGLQKEKDIVIKNYRKELCKKLERKIELNLGRRFELLNCEEVIDSYITWLRENNQYDNIITQDLRINKKAINQAFVGLKMGIGLAHATHVKQKGGSTTSPHNILDIRKVSYLNNIGIITFEYSCRTLYQI